MMNQTGLERMDRTDWSPQFGVVLVVDDSPSVCQVLERQLGSLGRVAICFQSPEQAVTYLLDPQVQVDWAIIDLRLGEHDGLALLDFLAQRRPAVRRVLISGAVGPSLLEQYRLEGRAHAVMSKPWDRQALASALKL